MTNFKVILQDGEMAIDKQRVRKGQKQFESDKGKNVKKVQ